LLSKGEVHEFKKIESVVSSFLKAMSKKPPSVLEFLLDNKAKIADAWYPDFDCKSTYEAIAKAIKEGLEKKTKEDDEHEDTGPNGAKRKLWKAFAKLESEETLHSFRRYLWVSRLIEEIKEGGNANSEANDSKIAALLGKDIFAGITKEQVEDYIITAFPKANLSCKKCFNCNAEIGKLKGDILSYVCSCGAHFSDRVAFLSGKTGITQKFTSLEDAYNEALSVLDATQLSEKVRWFERVYFELNRDIGNFNAKYSYYRDSADLMAKAEDLHKKLLASQKDIVQAEPLAMLGKPIWCGALIALINRNYNKFLGNVGETVELVRTKLSDSERKMFDGALRYLQASNQKLFLAQLFMLNCERKGSDYRLIYFIGKTERSFINKDVSDLKEMFKNFATCTDEVLLNQLEVFAKYLLDLAVKRLNIDITSWKDELKEIKRLL